MVTPATTNFRLRGIELIRDPSCNEGYQAVIDILENGSQRMRKYSLSTCIEAPTFGNALLF
jgi:hypothetical protein